MPSLSRGVYVRPGGSPIWNPLEREDSRMSVTSDSEGTYENKKSKRLFNNNISTGTGI